MNKLIEQLTIEAFFDEATNGSGQKMYTFGEEKMQKFAELIVKECAEVAEFVEQNSSIEKVSTVLRRHFRVEE